MSHFESFGVWISDYASRVLVPAVKDRVSAAEVIRHEGCLSVHGDSYKLRTLTTDHALRQSTIASIVECFEVGLFAVPNRVLFSRDLILKMRIEAFLNLLEKQPILRRHKGDQRTVGESKGSAGSQKESKGSDTTI